MFKNITINMDYPICNCDTLNLGWGIWQDDNKNNCLSLECRTCKTLLKISHDTFKAQFAFHKVPYKNMRGGPLPDNVIKLR